MEALPGSGEQPLLGQIVSGSDLSLERFKLMRIRAIVSRSATSVKDMAVWGILLALVLTLLSWFFFGIICGIDFHVSVVLQWMYLVLLALNVLSLLLTLGWIAWRSVCQRTPFRLMYEALLVHKMAKGNARGFKQLTRSEIESCVQSERSAKLFVAVMRGIWRAGFRDGRLRR